MSELKNVYFAMVTRNVKNAGTDSMVSLIVNENGQDKVHYSWRDTWGRDQERGEANLYKLEEAVNVDIERGNLNDSSVRVGIHGVDQWSPEHFFVWGETRTGNTVLPVAMELDIGTKLSTDLTEQGKLSIPVRLAQPGGTNTTIRRLLLLLLTHHDEHARTHDEIVVKVSSAAGVLVNHTIGNTPQYDLERNQANWYWIEVPKPFTRGNLSNDSIRLRIKGHNAWLPTSLFVFGLDKAKGRPSMVVPLVNIPYWESAGFGWMSTDSSEGVEEVVLPLAPL